MTRIEHDFLYVILFLALEKGETIVSETLQISLSRGGLYRATLAMRRGLAVFVVTTR